MQDPIFLLTISGAGLVGLTVLAFTALTGWRGWLRLEQMKLERHGMSGNSWDGGREPGPTGPSPAARIEIADLKERIRKLEAIAAGVDL